MRHEFWSLVVTCFWLCEEFATLQKQASNNDNDALFFFLKCSNRITFYITWHFSFVHKTEMLRTVDILTQKHLYHSSSVECVYCSKYVGDLACKWADVWLWVQNLVWFVSFHFISFILVFLAKLNPVTSISTVSFIKFLDWQEVALIPVDWVATQG